MNNDLEILTDGQLLKKKWETEQKITGINLAISNNKSNPTSSNLSLVNLIEDRTHYETLINDIESMIQTRTKLTA